MDILLHMCCGPCSCYPLKKLREEGYRVSGYFFNPNIHPYKEFKRRLETAEEFAAKEKMPIYVDKQYVLRTFLQKALAAEQMPEDLEHKPRCQMCYTWRLHQAAVFAKEHNFKAFTSSLLVSPYQQHAFIKKIGEQLAQKVGVEFYYEDFREGWDEGVEICQTLELYRQPYCGCIFSEEERYSNRWKKEHKKKVKKWLQERRALQG